MRAPLTVAVALALVPASAAAQGQASLVPSASVFAVYDDNLFASQRGSAGQMLEIRPSVEANYESAVTSLFGLYTFDIQRSNYSSLNTFDARRHALANIRVRTSPALMVGFNARYDRSETPGELDMDTGILGARLQAERLQATPTLTYRFNARTSTSSSYDWTSERLVGDDWGTLHVGRWNLARDVTSRTTVTGGYVGRYFVDPIERHWSHAGLLGWSRELSPGTRFTLTAGPKATSYRGIVPEASAQFLRTTNRIKVGLDYWHGETIVLGIRGPVAADSATARVSWPIRRTMELGIHTGVSDIATLDRRNTTIYRGTLVTSWSPRGSMFTVAASYGIDAQRGTIRRLPEELQFPPGRYILRHVVRIGLTVAPRLNRSLLPADEAARAKGVTR